MAGNRKLTVELLGDARGMTGAFAEVEQKSGRLHGAFNALSVAGGTAFTQLGGKALEFGKASIQAATDMAETESKVKVIFGTMAEASAVSTEQVMADKTALSTAEQKYQDAVEAATSKTGKARDTAMAKVEEWRKKVEAAQGKVAENDRLNAEAHEKFMASGAQLSDEFAKQIEKFAGSAAKNYGQSKQQAMSAAAGFATFGKAAGLNGQELVDFSTKLTGLSSDMASFSNTTPDEAIEAVGAALRGESEPIRKYGVLLNEASLKAKAMEMGLYDGKGALDAQAKTMATYQLILDKTKDAQGDFARTSDGLANKQRIMQAQMDNLKVSLGEKLLPVQLAVTNGLLKLVDAAAAVVPVVGKVIGVVTDFAGKLADGLSPVIGASIEIMGKIGGAIGDGIDAIKGDWSKKWDLIAGIGKSVWENAILAPIKGYALLLQGELKAVWELLHGDWRGAWEQIRNTGQQIWDLAPDSIKNVITGGLGQVKTWISDIVPDVSANWSGMWDGLKNAFGDDGPWGVVRGAAVEGLATVKEWISGIGGEMSSSWSTVWDALKKAFSTVWGEISGVASGALGEVKGWISGIGTDLETAWKIVWTNLSIAFSGVWHGATGIGSKILSAVGSVGRAFDAVSSAIETLMGWLGRIDWPEPPGWVKSIIGTGGDVAGGIANWLTGGNNPASASPAPGGNGGNSGGGQPIQVKAPPKTTAAPPGAPSGASAGNTYTDVNNVTWTADGSGGWSSGGGEFGDVGPGANTASGAGGGGNAGMGVIGAGSGGVVGTGGAGAGIGAGGGLGNAIDIIGTAGAAAGNELFDGDGEDNSAPIPEAPAPGVDGYRKAFLSLIGFTEGTDDLHGYQTLYGGGKFDSFADHPRRAITAGAYTSTAAGRYQFLSKTWDWVAGQLGLKDFSPASQDKAALWLINNKGALDEIDKGNMTAASKILGGTWTSLPGGTQPNPRTSKAADKWAELTGNTAAPASSDQFASLYKNGRHFLEVTDRFDKGFTPSDKVNRFALNAMLMTQKYGLNVASGYRSASKQAGLYAADIANNGGKPSGAVARSSQHTLGLAMDIHTPNDSMLEEFGLWRPLWPGPHNDRGSLANAIASLSRPKHKGPDGLTYENWHVEPKGSRSWYKAATGGYLDRPTFLLAGEAGAEVVLPLTNMTRMAELIHDDRVLFPVMTALLGSEAGKTDATRGPDRAISPIVTALLNAEPGKADSTRPTVVVVAPQRVADNAVANPTTYVAPGSYVPPGVGNRAGVSAEEAAAYAVVGAGGTVINIDSLIGELSVTGGSLTPAQAKDIARQIYEPFRELVATKGHVTVNGNWRIDG